MIAQEKRNESKTARRDARGFVRTSDAHESAASDAGARIRVLVVAPSLRFVGGQSRQAERLVAGLTTEPSLHVGFLPHDPSLPGPFRLLQRAKYVRTVVTTALYVLLLLINVPRYDVIHVFSAAYWAYLLSAVPAILIARLFGKSVILNYRSGEAEDHLSKWPHIAPLTMRLATVIVVCSGYLVDVFARHELRARFIYDFVELDRFAYRERKPLRVIFLATRSLEPLYNVACLLRGFALIQRRYPEARLTIAGDGRQRQQLERLAFNELRLRHTEFIGFVPFEKMPELYDAADVYLTSPNIDNMPGSITECMAAGLPIVTTNAGGIPYIVKHEETCLMVACDDHEAIAASACRLLEDPQLALKLARRAREECRKYTWPAVRDEWLRLYHKLARRAGTQRERSGDILRRRTEP